MSWLAVYFEVCVTLGHNAKCARPPDLTILKRPFVLETAEELPGRVASRGMNIILEALMRCSNDASRGMSQVRLVADGVGAPSFASAGQRKLTQMSAVREAS